MIEGMEDLLSLAVSFKPLFAVLVAVGVALILARIIREVAHRAFRRTPGIREVSLKARNPLRLGLSLIGTRIALGATAAGAAWLPAVDYVLVLGSKTFLPQLEQGIEGIRSIVSEEVNAALEKCKAAAVERGTCPGIDPFMTMSFASLPVIPTLRLTTRGVIDVNTQTLID